MIDDYSEFRGVIRITRRTACRNVQLRVFQGCVNAAFMKDVKARNIDNEKRKCYVEGIDISEDMVKKAISLNHKLVRIMAY
jgi:hypothetical protein